MASRNIYDPHGLHDFLINSTRPTSIFDDEVVDVLADVFIQTPRYRNFLKNLCDMTHGGNIVQRCTQEALNDLGTLFCTPIRAVEFIVDLRMPRTRYPILQEFISDFSHKFTQRLRVQWSPRLPSLKTVNDNWRELCSEMRLEPPKLTTQDRAIGISWSILEVVKFIQRHKVLHSAWDTSMPLTLIVRGDAAPFAGTQCSQVCITFANWGQLTRNVSRQFIIGVAYCDDKDATILASLWKTNIKVCVTMRPSWLFTSDCSIDELKFQLVQLNITTYNAPSLLSSCCKLSLTVQHFSGSGRRSIAKSGSGVTSCGCGDGWDYRNIGRSLVYMHFPFGKGLNVSSSPMPFGAPMPRKPHTERLVVLVCNDVVVRGHHSFVWTVGDLYNVSSMASWP